MYTELYTVCIGCEEPIRVHLVYSKYNEYVLGPHGLFTQHVTENVPLNTTIYMEQ